MSIRIKTVLLGRDQVGKTQILNFFLERPFNDREQSTIGAVFAKKELDLKPPHKATLEIWDTSGKSAYKPLTKIFMKDAPFGIFVYDPFRRETFEEVNWYVSEFMQINKDSCIFYI